MAGKSPKHPTRCCTQLPAAPKAPLLFHSCSCQIDAAPNSLLPPNPCRSQIAATPTSPLLTTGRKIRVSRIVAAKCLQPKSKTHRHVDLAISADTAFSLCKAHGHRAPRVATPSLLFSAKLPHATHHPSVNLGCCVVSFFFF